MIKDAYILIVDDEQNIINAIQRQLHSTGYKCLGTTSGKEAIQLLQQEKIAIILCDQKMPEMSGPELLKVALDVSPDTERVTITGYSDIQMTADAINHGRISRFLFKPFEQSSLLAVVEDCYAQYYTKKENIKLLKLQEEQNSKIKMLSERLIEYTAKQKNIFESSWLLQNSLLLGTPPTQLKNIQITAETLPAHTLDGDFVFFHEYSDTVFDMVVGDVMGKGLFAALTAASLRGYFMREWGRAEGIGVDLHTPSKIIQCINSSIEERLMEFNLFVSLIFVRFDLDAKIMTYVDSGGVKPLMYKYKTRRVETISGDNCPLGIPEGGTTVSQENRSFSDKDVLLFYSDGVLEEIDRSTGEFFGIERIKKCLLENSGFDSYIILSNLYKSLSAFRGQYFQSDDMTCVAIKFGHYESCMIDNTSKLLYDLSELELKSSYLELERLHQLLIESFNYSNLFADDLKQNAVILAVHEAFVNIIKHSYDEDQTKPIWLDISSYSDKLKVVLYDYGVTFNQDAIQKVDFSGKKSHGFGLYIINEIAEEVIYNIDSNARNSLQLIFK